MSTKSRKTGEGKILLQITDNKGTILYEEEEDQSAKLCSSETIAKNWLQRICRNCYSVDVLFRNLSDKNYIITENSVILVYKGIQEFLKIEIQTEIEKKRLVLMEEQMKIEEKTIEIQTEIEKKRLVLMEEQMKIEEKKRLVLMEMQMEMQMEIEKKELEMTTKKLKIRMRAMLKNNDKHKEHCAKLIPLRKDENLKWFKIDKEIDAEEIKLIRLALKEKVGSSITLPSLGILASSLLPKDLVGDEQLTFTFIFTQQMCDLLSKLIAASHKESSGGMVFSGPHGVGKSIVAYLFACFGVINSIPTVFIPLSATWLIGKSLYFLKQFYLLNADILPEIIDPERTIHLLNLLNGNTDNSEKLQRDIMQNLTDIKNSMVLYVFDEHNELFKDEEWNPRTDEYFSNFTKWTGLTNGSRTFTVYSGSAHSKFEDKLPGGEVGKLQHFQIPSEKEGLAILKQYSEPVSEEEQNFWKGRHAKEIDLFVVKLTGVPREMKLYMVEYQRNVRKYITTMLDAYTRRLGDLWDKADDTKRNNLISSLNAMFEYRSTSIQRVSSAIRDKGIVYCDRNGFYHPISDVARSALSKFYFDYLKIPSVELGTTIGGTNLEIHCIQKEVVNSFKAYFIPICPATSKAMELKLVEYNVERCKKFSLKDMSVFNYISEVTLFYPDKTNFAYIDYLVYDPDKRVLYAKQVTVQSVREHSRGKKSKAKPSTTKPTKAKPRKAKKKKATTDDISEMRSFFTSKSYSYKENNDFHLYRPKTNSGEYSLCDVIVQQLYKTEPRSESNAVRPVFEFVKDDNGKETFQCNGNNLPTNPITVDFVYVTGKPEREAKGDFQVPTKLNAYYYAQETLIGFGIPFAGINSVG